MAKAQDATGNPLRTSGNIFISLNNNDKKPKAVNLLKRFEELGFGIFATHGTNKFLRENKIKSEPVFKVNEGRPNIVDLIKNGEIHLVINTPLGEESRFDEYAIGWAAVQHKIPFITTLSAAQSVVEGIARIKSHDLSVKSLQEYYKN